MARGRARGRCASTDGSGAEPRWQRGPELTPHPPRRQPRGRARCDRGRAGRRPGGGGAAHGTGGGGVGHGIGGGCTAHGTGGGGGDVAHGTGGGGVAHGTGGGGVGHGIGGGCTAYGVGGGCAAHGTGDGGVAHGTGGGCAAHGTGGGGVAHGTGGGGGDVAHGTGGGGVAHGTGGSAGPEPRPSQRLLGHRDLPPNQTRPLPAPQGEVRPLENRWSAQPCSKCRSSYSDVTDSGGGTRDRGTLCPLEPLTGKRSERKRFQAIKTQNCNKTEHVLRRSTFRCAMSSFSSTSHQHLASSPRQK
ncbi:loricrin-like [Prinia subflava]|uniref:loricrin-like n=1 Tax=Prinia subflava TaxID=208062 RepID=UPI002FE0BB7C